MNESKYIQQSGSSKHESRLAKAMYSITQTPYSDIPKGVFGSEAKIKCGGITISSKDIDFEFRVPFDDDLVPNEAEITIYNLSANTVSKFEWKSKVTIEAGYKGDTGVIFTGYVSRVFQKHDGADKSITIKCVDDINKRSVSNLSFAAGTKASYILKTLLNKTETPIAVYSTRRDYTYTDAVTVDGDLMDNIKRYAEVCGISVYVSKGKIYARYIKNGDNLNFTLSSDTGLLGTPEAFLEDNEGDGYTERVRGFNCNCLLQHRMAAAGIVTIKSKTANGNYRIRSGEHTFNESEATTKIEVI